MIEIGVHIFVVIHNSISTVIFINLTFLGSYFIIETCPSYRPIPIMLGKQRKTIIIIV